MKVKLTDALVLGTLVGIGVFANLPIAHAITAPTSGTFAYTVYDVGVEKILKGPIGFVGGIAAIVYGAVAAIQGKVMAAIPAVVGGAVMLESDSIVSSLGALV